MSTNLLKWRPPCSGGPTTEWPPGRTPEPVLLEGTSRMDDLPSSPAMREVVAVFGSERSFSDAIDALQSSGIDRARISVLSAGTPEAGRRLTAMGFRTVADLLDAQEVPCTVYEQPEEIGALRGLAISGLVHVGATLGAGLAAASVGAFLTRRLGSPRSAYVEQSLAHGGLVPRVTIRDEKDEHRLTHLLEEHGGGSVHVHDGARTRSAI